MKQILLLPNSLYGEVWNHFSYWSRQISASDVVMVFHDFEYYAEVAEIKNNYRTALAEFRRRGVQLGQVKQDCLESYLLAHKNMEELYLTPVKSSELAVSAGVACDYCGNLFALGASETEPPVKNLTRQIRSAKLNSNTGSRVLDKNAAKADHTPGSMCYYTIDGKSYQQTLPANNGKNRGAEGYVIPAADRRYCLKIWDGYDRPAYSNDKIRAMLRIPQPHPDIALPLALVFNQYHEPIGICMRYFEGQLCPLDRLNRSDLCLKLCQDLLSQAIWLQTRQILPRDMWHNVLVSDSGAHIIDLESAQFHSYPATACSEDIENYLPDRFRTNGLFHSTVEQYYTMLDMLIYLYYGDKDDLNRLLWDNTKNKVSVNRQMLSYLPAELQSLVLQAYEEEKPVSLIKQLRFVNEQLAYQESAVSKESYEAIENELASDYERAEKVPVMVEYEYTAPQEAPRKQPARREQDKPKPASPAPQQRPADVRKKSWLVRKLQMLIIRLFGSTSGTIIMDGNVPADPWDVFMRSGAWKKPFAVSILSVALILTMLLAIAAM